MARTIPGIHHVTAICGPPQPNLDFYTGPLGQRLVKKTVNFDAPDTYHLIMATERARRMICTAHNLLKLAMARG